MEKIRVKTNEVTLTLKDIKIVTKERESKENEVIIFIYNKRELKAAIEVLK